MHELRYPFSVAIPADTLSSPVDAGVSVTEVDLTAGEFAKWARHDILWIDEAASSAHREVVRIVDATANRLTFDHALPIAPTSAATLKGGLLEWATAASSIRYAKPRYSSPVDPLLDSDPYGCAILYGMATRWHMFGSADEETWELRAVSRSAQFAEGCAHRMRRLFHGKPGSLTTTAFHIERLDAGPVVERLREDDEFREFLVPLTAWVAELVA